MSRTEAMRELFARWHSSGLSLMAFGKQEGVAYAKLLYWKKKFASEAGASNVDRDELVPITVVPDSPSHPATTPSRFEVWLANGVCLEVAAGFDERELRRLVRVLQAC